MKNLNNNKRQFCIKSISGKSAVIIASTEKKAKEIFSHIYFNEVIETIY